MIVALLLLLCAAPSPAETSVSTAAPKAAAKPAAPPIYPKTVGRVERHVTKTITILMQRLAESKIAPQVRSKLNERLLAIEAEAAAVTKAGKPPEGEDVDAYAVRMGKKMDEAAGAIDAAMGR